jgi:hypothetical protein
MEGVMRNHCDNRLTVIGTKRDVRRFQAGDWHQMLRARHSDPLEFSPCRFVCQFETTNHDLKRLQLLSRRWPGLVLLLDFEIVRGRIKGLAKAKGGELEHCEIGC